ncbi:MAG: T9SS type A sorting domain-containing protein, partial [Ignavibacteriaceae bacterium]|nr:T9SS type A sorting domain-containing protein [Ignavibacteriaceae bacterium]
MKKGFLSIVLILICTIELFPQKVGDAYALNINNIYMPLNRKGVLADVNVPPNGSEGQFGGHSFLFSGGFFLSGFSNGNLWANAVASASLVEDYLPGNVDGEWNPNAVLYRVGSADPPFGQSWLAWVDAVSLGADFYDGDGDGVYNPVDKNVNGIWDLDEDCPDILGDETLWCVYHDGLPVLQRRWNTTIEVGIEVRQTVFAYSSVSELQNIIFIRYRIKYVGLTPSDPDELTDVYFGIWDDPDIGTATNDLVGCDTLLNGQYTYNWYSDPTYGNNPPSFFVRTLSGPVTYIPGVTFIDNNLNGTYDEGIDTPIDTAYVHRGQVIGVKTYPGAANQNLSSAIGYINGDVNLQDPITKDQARNYMLGLTRLGDIVDPCIWPYGTVQGGVDCSQINPMFWYSGDRVNNYGWINNTPRDQRQLENVGPFTLEKDKEFEIFVAYVVGQSTDWLTSITESKNISAVAGVLYNSNFDTNSVVSVEEIYGSIIPEEYFLSQNYPNPFNPITTIEFSIPKAGSVSLVIYDVLGNEVATLVNENLQAGTYKTEFDSQSGEGRNLVSGVYFYQLLVSDLQSKDGKTE